MASDGEGDNRTFMALVFVAFVLFLWFNNPSRVDPPIDTLEKALRIAGGHEGLNRFAWDHQPVAAFGLGHRTPNRFVLVLMSRCVEGEPATCNGTAIKAEIDAWKAQVISVRQEVMSDPPGINDTFPRAADSLELPVDTLPELLKAASASESFLGFIADNPPPYGFVHRCNETCALVAGADCSPGACTHLWRVEVEPSTGSVTASAAVDREVATSTDAQATPTTVLPPLLPGTA
ncbi:MAG: hypothetical protein QF415_15740 [Candidatus Undinarchaeales archaeon]|jgi:hypothetical protein|nr:hypothetical protein [Candidatus Undinarchaeales archaeon]MDP7494631.1 hypothetical protein [Candidatus Undinarchaeales archaeon]